MSELVQRTLFDLSPYDKLFNSPLPPEVYSNLIDAVPIPMQGEYYPIIYSKEIVQDILKFIVITVNPYHSFFTPAMKENCWQFANTFGLNLQSTLFKLPDANNMSYIEPGKVDYLDTIMDDFDGALKELRNSHVIWWQGRFNGPPHAGYIETLLLLKQAYPNNKICLSLDPDETSVNKNQLLFLNPILRASMFMTTGLVDRILINRYSRSMDNLDYYWAGIHGLVRPTYYLDLYEDGLQEVTQKPSSSVYSIPIYNLPKSITSHGSELRKSDTDPNDVVKSWSIVRNLMKNL